MTWSMFIPTSMLALGAIAMVLAVVLVFVDVPGKGIPWDKVGAWLAVIGGFGVGGAAGGAVGDGLASLSENVLTNGQLFTAQALGAGVVGAILAGMALWAYARVRDKGIATRSKFKSLFVVFALAVVGSVLAAIPELYPLADRGMAWLGTGLIRLIQ